MGEQAGLQSCADAPARAPVRPCPVSGTRVLEFVGARRSGCGLALHWVPPHTDSRGCAASAALLHPRLNLGPRSTFMHGGGSPVFSWRPPG